MADQWALPESDVTDGSWLSRAGINTDLFESVNEAEADITDIDYIESAAEPSSDTCKMRLSAISTPASGDVVLHIRGRWGSGATGGTEVAFVWSPWPTATRYVLRVGPFSGHYTVFDADVGFVLTYYLSLEPGTYYSQVLAYNGLTLVQTKAEQTVTIT